MNRWSVGGLLGLAGGAALAYAVQIERARVTVDRFDVRVGRRGLPPAGLTILHLSDFHFRARGSVQSRKIARARALLADAPYDVVALTGDLIHDSEGLDTALDFIRTLRPRCGMYYVPGNHDYAEYTPWGVFGPTWQDSAGRRPRGLPGGLSGLGDLRQVARSLIDFVGKVARNELVRMPVRFNNVPAILRALEEIGVQPLVNRSARLDLDGYEVWFAGVDDLTESTPDLSAALEQAPAGVPVVLLAHNPDIWLQCGVDRADLVLAGHTHGGQIRLPFMGAVHTQGTHLVRRQAAGWFERGRSRMFVNRGLGESIPLRFGAGPQMALITLRSAAEEWET